MAKEEGVIKFNCNWKKTGPFPEEPLADINEARQQCKERGFIGVDENGIGFGNLSFRIGESSQFLITATQTSKLDALTGNHYAKVTSYNIDENSVTAEGAMKPSSESLTHAGIYEGSSMINAVIHVHNQELFKAYVNKVATVPAEIQASGPEMANAVKDMLGNLTCRLQKVIVMAGHDNGVLFYGNDIIDAKNIMIHYYRAAMG